MKRECFDCLRISKKSNRPTKSYLVTFPSHLIKKDSEYCRSQLEKNNNAFTKNYATALSKVNGAIDRLNMVSLVIGSIDQSFGTSVDDAEEEHATNIQTQRLPEAAAIPPPQEYQQPAAVKPGQPATQQKQLVPPQQQSSVTRQQEQYAVGQLRQPAAQQEQAVPPQQLVALPLQRYTTGPAQAQESAGQPQESAVQPQESAVQPQQQEMLAPQQSVETAAKLQNLPLLQQVASSAAAAPTSETNYTKEEIRQKIQAIKAVQHQNRAGQQLVSPQQQSSVTRHQEQYAVGQLQQPASQQEQSVPPQQLVALPLQQYTTGPPQPEESAMQPQQQEMPVPQQCVETAAQLQNLPLLQHVTSAATAAPTSETIYTKEEIRQKIRTIKAAVGQSPSTYAGVPPPTAPSPLVQPSKQSATQPAATPQTSEALDENARVHHPVSSAVTAHLNMDEVHSASVKCMQLSVGSQVCVLTKEFAVKSPNDFYVQLFDCPELIPFNQELQKHYSENYVAGFEYVPDAGTYCVAMFMVDGTYKAGRAIVRNVLENGYIHVLCIDSGNEEILSMARIRLLIKRFASMPWLVVHCNLSKVVPPNGQTSWTKQNKDFFSKLISEEGVEMQMMVKECCRWGENANVGVMYGVELFQLRQGYFYSIAGIMDRNGEAACLQ